MNFHDAERLSGLLDAEGYERVDTADAADLVVLNTCSVRERAEEKLYARLGDLRARAERDEVVLAVTGCVAQQEGEKLLAREPSIDVVVGTQRMPHLPRLVDEALAAREPRVETSPRDDVAFPLGIARHSDPVRAWVTIIEGCNEYCAFCVVPYTRGHERMRPASDIVAETARAAASGRVEVQLLGQIVNHYVDPADPSCDFPALLERVSAVPGIVRVRFASPHPRHVSDRLIAAIRDLPKVAKLLHLPVQSGSTRILTAMRRRYTREGYLDLVDRLRASVPDIELSTDIIVGFPGETVEDFEETMTLVRRVGFQSIFSFKYSPRPNTLASKRLPDGVTEGEKTLRIVALQALQREIQLERNHAAVGRTVQVLADGPSARRQDELAGRTSGNAIVNFPGPTEMVGQLVAVEITEGGANSLRGRLASAEL